jgi:type VI secretion system secreted protein VgrG
MPQSDDSRPNARLFTPLPEGVLLLRSFQGSEYLSKPFEFTLSLYSPNKKKAQVEFDKLLGKEFTIESDIYSREKEKRTGEFRYISGVCFEFSEGAQDSQFTNYTAVIVPKFQMLSLKSNCRIFQQKSVPDVLKEVLPSSGVEFQLEGKFDKREYCVQYRETDLAFASRLMEEEGIFYFFKYAKSGHTMVVANSSLKHPKVQEPATVDLDPSEGGSRRAGHLSSWHKVQRMKTGKYTLRDHHFQLPNSNLEAGKTTQGSAAAGKVDHKLQVGGNDDYEIYDYPGGYAKRVDGINKSGGDQPPDLQSVHSDNQRTVKIRMQAEAAEAMSIQSESNCIHLAAGHKFSLEESDATTGFKGDGDYVLTEVHHDGNVDVDHRTGDSSKFSYTNTVKCIPMQIEFKPQRATPKPTVQGMQSATVVGPSGEEIFTDKYGRVKVQFRWDRDGKSDANSSCWLRVASSWAGKQWGMINIPRIGQEVIVGFLEGDPDSPIVLGSVYNPNTMPPYTLPDNKTQSGIKTRSSTGGSPDNFNEIRFEDKKGGEMLTIHAEKDEDIHVEHDKTEKVDHDETITIGNNRTETVGLNQSVTVTSEDSLTVGANQTISIGIAQSETIGAERTTTVGAADTLSVGAALTISAGAAIDISAGAEITINAGAALTINSAAALVISSAAAITITAPALLLNGRPVLPLPAPPI